MKKIVILMLTLVLSMSFTTIAFSASTFCDATTGTCTYTASTFGGGEYRPSAKVTVTVSTDTNGLGYCGSSQHSGAATNQVAGKQYATLSTSPQIFVGQSETTPGPKPCTSTAVPPTLPTAPTGGWN